MNTEYPLPKRRRRTGDADGRWVNGDAPSDRIFKPAVDTRKKPSEYTKEAQETATDVLDLKKWQGYIPRPSHMEGVKNPDPRVIAAKVVLKILEPIPVADGTLPDWTTPTPTWPPQKPKGDQESICGKGPIRVKGRYSPGMPTAMSQYGIYPYDSGRPYASQNPEKIGIVKCDSRRTMVPLRPDGSQVQLKRNTFQYAKLSIPGKIKRRMPYTQTVQLFATQIYGPYPYSDEIYVSSPIYMKHFPEMGYRDPIEGYDGVAMYPSNDIVLGAKLECTVPIFYDDDFADTVDPNDYGRKGDDDMGCKWQKDEQAYELPKLKIGALEIGGNSINIDDGLKPLAEYLCKSVEMMHKGMGLNLLDDKEFPVSLLNQGGEKVKPSSLAQLSQWQFDNVSSLVGLPIKNTLTNIEDQTSDIQFRSVQDCLSFMFHQQKESDTDLAVLEGYCSRIAQQLEAVTQICLRQHADIEMIIQELGFKYKIETEKRPSLYKLGMKADDEVTGILELFKGGEVSYPVRKWDDEFDQRQIALRTNLYAEISARSFLQPKNTKDELPGLDARIKMTKENKEDWLEWVKTINEPEEGTYAGGTMPYIEEFTPGTKESKKIATPASGLSLFMKPVVKGKKK